MRTGFLSGALWFGRPGARSSNTGPPSSRSSICSSSPPTVTAVGLLPYGMQKRIELGRALAMEPRLLLLDEPVAGMNLEETEDMARYILEVRDELDLSMVLVEHDMHMVMDLADRVHGARLRRPHRHGHP